MEVKKGSVIQKKGWGAVELMQAEQQNEKKNNLKSDNSLRDLKDNIK